VAKACSGPKAQAPARLLDLKPRGTIETDKGS
jgi:hypothetical protein